MKRFLRILGRTTSQSATKISMVEVATETTLEKPMRIMTMNTKTSNITT